MVNRKVIINKEVYLYLNNTIIELIKLGIVFTEPPPELMHNYDNVNIALFSLYRIFTQKVKTYTNKL